MAKYSLGLDFGTQSGRAALVEIGTGTEVATSVYAYPHGVMDEYLMDSDTRLEPDTALQYPGDYMGVLKNAIPDVIKHSGVNPEDIVGVGVDFTSCTMMPVGADGTPLCFYKEFEGEPHAYVKLWKHHAAQDETDYINETAENRGEPFLARYGGKISSEWTFPKLLQILNDAPHIYNKMDKFMHLGDWIVLQLTGKRACSSVYMGYKAMWSKREGWPKSAFFKALDPRFEHAVEQKLAQPMACPWDKAGEVTPEMAELTGLAPGTAVAHAHADAQASFPAAGIAEPGRMLLIMGTSSCHFVLGEKECNVPGISGFLEDGVMPGWIGFEAGQCCCGDHFEWFVNNCVPGAYEKEARERGMNIHGLLCEKAGRLRPGQSGLMALDWWNGNRSVLEDANLTGMIAGLTLLSKPEEIYRALIEATAYGTRMIIDNYKAHGIAVNEIIACGGIAQKNSMLMQIYADVCDCGIRIVESAQAGAVGSAIIGAVAAGKAKGGYGDMNSAVKEMSRLKDIEYKPCSSSAGMYDTLYKEYTLLHDYFGKGANDVMKRLKNMRLNA